MSSPHLNDVASLRQGIVRTRNQREFTILLVGETGVGKTSVLSLIANILAGRSPEQYIDVYYTDNEAGGSQKDSQTKTAQIYEFRSKNDVTIRILDTPGLADTRGLAQDKLHKQSIARAIQRHITTVNAVLILANGTVPRLGVATEYALTTLSAIFPCTLANNIGIMFTNVGDPLNCNFEENSLPDVLRNANQYLLDNPVAMQKKFLEQKKKGTLQKALPKMQRRVQESEEMALDTLTEIFDWLDGLVPQPTKDIISLHDKSQNIERNIDSALARMTQATDKDRELRKIAADLNKAKVDMTTYENFESTITKKIRVQKNTAQHNTNCSHPGCYSNCHEDCSLNFTLDPSGLSGCVAMGNGICNKCGHGLHYHRHYNSIWKLVDDRQVVVDPTAKVRFKSAKDEKTKKEQLMAAVQRVRDDLTKSIDEETFELGRLVTEYAALSLTGSFSGQVYKSVSLLELNLEKMRESGADEDAIKKVERSLETLRAQLRVLRKAEKSRVWLSAQVTAASARYINRPYPT